MKQPRQNAGQVNEKLLQLLMQVAVNDEPVQAKTLSEQLNVPLSSLYRHLKLLKEWSLIEESPHDKTLIIGPAALLLMRSYETSPHNLDAVEAVLCRLQKQTGEMAAYMVPVGYRALCVSRKESMQALRCSYVQGQSQPLLRGASSKVMLAFMPASRCEKILRHFGEAHRLHEWQGELEQIRKQGYAVSTSEIDPGVSGISAPVMKGSKLVGAVSVMAPAHRVQRDKQRIILHVLQASRALPPER
ncbi:MULTISPECIES: IclR family transcriptional regulator [Vibrio]|uniref:HTH-type transcriptional repressor AllR n=1 Tax=Vibrio proteolyticus NBRC 13287 TaxID=1219065 RepID=U2ZLY8_VIBPR|nr:MULTISPECIES: IclR family transcriptional regulator [Vibrio]NAW56226.1 HTH domain-containing protein [Vibrio sp. V36_P2S2PM302]NAX19690.1 HTH domain-containing protein [Vibrio sp. V39_P1S14PM300]NAX25500.1 HTH domain-containing protein [Vibrio sp. V38_P2S17PM301]GAD68776.1 putative IclR family transcriptional regulator [Vibrio proteolyticus NBRC 13287]